MATELNINNIKNLGQVSTPDSVVDFMLDAVGYKRETILNKHILDNSCGDGAFLKSVVKRYIKVAETKNMSQEEIKKRLGNLYSWGRNRPLCLWKLREES